MHPTAHDGAVSYLAMRESGGVGEALERIGSERMIVAMRIMGNDFQEVINQLIPFVALRCCCGWGGCGDGRDLTDVN